MEKTVEIKAKTHKGRIYQKHFKAGLKETNRHIMYLKGRKPAPKAQ